MQYDKELIAHKLDRWDRFITDYHLPEWDSIPDLGLYMDQVVVLLAQYLNFIPAMPGGKESFVTSSTINNYVRLKIMPAPVKRKYFRWPSAENLRKYKSYPAWQWPPPLFFPNIAY